MAIQFARAEYVSRSDGKNACCKGAYNARTQINDNKTNITYNFQRKDDNVHHEILLPEYVDKKFKNVSTLMNEVERIERKSNSQLLKEYDIALPDGDNISLEIKKEMGYEFIKENNWIEAGLAVQIDIHEPHLDDKNWHAHLLITTRRFLDHGKCLGTKARDIDPQVRGGRTNTYVKSNEEINIGKLWAEVQNKAFKKHGLENRVDAISQLPQEHIGPVRMRSVMNQASERNEARQLANIEQLNSGLALIDRVSANMSVFAKGDLARAVKCIPDDGRRNQIFSEALESNLLVPLYTEDGAVTKYFTTHEIRFEEQKLMRLGGYVFNEENIVTSSNKKWSRSNLQQLISDGSVGLSEEQAKALSSILLDNNGLRILRGRAGSGKSYLLGQANSIASNAGINVIGLAPTHRAKLELGSKGFKSVDTIKGMLFKLANGRFDLPKNSLLVVDEAGMIGNDDMSELLRVAATRKCNVILSGDERQLASVSRGSMFEIFANKYGSSSILDIKRQDSQWGRNVAMAMSEGNVETAISILDGKQRIKWEKDASISMSSLLSDWSKSDFDIDDRMILAVRNKDVAAINPTFRTKILNNCI
jgi:hypothetical protein